MIANLTRYKIVEAAAVTAVAASVFIRLWQSGIDSIYTVHGSFDLVFRPALMLFFLIAGRNGASQTGNVDCRSLIGVILSFGAPLGFSATRLTDFSIFLAVTSLSASLFYAGFIVTSYLALGRSLSIFPAAKGLVQKGSYSVVRHPIYSGYLLLSACFVAVFPSIQNFMSLGAMVLGLNLRAGAEERVLSSNLDYEIYMRAVPRRIIGPILLLPLAAIVATSIFLRLNAATKPPHTIKIQLAYPILSLDPRIYDDWSSVFVGNHIFRRLIADPNVPDGAALSTFGGVTCEDALSSKHLSLCLTQQIKLTLKSGVSDCTGKPLESTRIKSELSAILSSKPWILPSWSFCDAAENEICLHGPSILDHERRLRSLYLRFGWINQEHKTPGLSGSGPYCLKVNSQIGGSIASATLIPHHDFATALPRIELTTSQNPKDLFDIALYGEESLVTKNRHNIHTNTPLGYYVVTHRKFAGHTVPWNQQEAREVIRDHFISHGIIEKEVANYVQGFLPQGGAESSDTLPVESIPSTQSAEASLIIPDYISACHDLSQRLNLLFSTLKNPKANAICKDLVSFQKNHVWPVSGDGNFDAFLSPLSPGTPARDSIRFQYFSPNSPESYTQDFPRPDELFYLVGAGPSWITVDGERFCDVRANSMGLGNVFATDFIHCSDVTSAPQ